MQSTCFQNQGQITKKALIENYRILNDIGKGSFGNVMRAESKMYPGKFVAVKTLRSKIGSPKDFCRLREYSFFANVPKHPNLANCYEMFINSYTAGAVFILELADMNLLQPIVWHRECGPLPICTYDVATLTRDILLGTAHIHKFGYVHRDIKPENILLKFMSDGTTSVKIADFGLSKRLDSESSRWTSYVATRWYRAPEQLLEIGNHTTALDVWSVSLVMCELCNLRPLLPGETATEMLQYQVEYLGLPDQFGLSDVEVNMRLKVEEGAFAKRRAPGLPMITKNKMHRVFESFIRLGLEWNPSDRPSASQMAQYLEHLLCTEIKENTVPIKTTPLEQKRRCYSL